MSTSLKHSKHCRRWSRLFGRYFRLTGPLLVIAMLSACTSNPDPVAFPQTVVSKTPVILTDPVTGNRYTYLSVLIYNVADMPWPVASGRGRSLDTIAWQLRAQRRWGMEPDVVLLQEAFTPKSHKMGLAAEYRNWTRGPRTGEDAPKVTETTDPEFIEARSFWKGEKLGKVISGGLYAFSNYPIIDTLSRPFKRYECAGFDCLSNKGLLLVRIQVPGVPVPVDIMTAHMNSKKSSGVSEERSHYAHNLQMDEMDAFLDQYRDSENPLIFGGDFNMKQARERLDYAASKLPYPVVRGYCSRKPDACDVRMSWDGDEPWLDTQDLQGFHSSENVSVTPMTVEAMFDEPVEGEMLSDHDGYFVVYRLEWASE